MDSPPGQAPENEKKPYRAPALVHYGDLSRVTDMVGMMGAMDGAAMVPRKTA
jgi:hypothetical protein